MLEKLDILNREEFVESYYCTSDVIYREKGLCIYVYGADITAIITKQENIEEMIAYALAVVILFAVVYGIIAIIKSISYFPQKRKIEQMECFASDLQGVLDFINSNTKKE